MLDYAIVSAANDTLVDTNDDNNLDEEIPWQLKGCQFNNDNVLIWTHDMLKFSTLSMTRPTVTSTKNLLSRHNKLIKASQLQIICVCGPRAKRIVRDLLGSAPTYKLKLRVSVYTLYVGKTGLLYLVCPELSSNAWSAKSFHNIKLSEAIRFAGKITKTEPLRPYFVESSSLICEVLIIASREKQGAEQITCETLPQGLRFWLQQVGFIYDEDVKRLSELAGSLIRGIIAVFHCRAKFARQAKVQRFKPLKGSSYSKPQAEESLLPSKPLDKSKWEDIITLFTRLHEKKKEDFTAKLQESMNQDSAQGYLSTRINLGAGYEQVHDSTTESALLELPELEIEQSELVSEIQTAMNTTANSSEMEEQPLIEEIFPIIGDQILRQEAVKASRPQTNRPQTSR